MNPPALVPQPLKLLREPGDLILAAETKIFFDPLFAEPAALLAEKLRPPTGFPFPCSTAPGSAQLTGKNICLALAPDLAEEEYHLLVKPDGARLSASTPQGMIHAVHSFLQLLPPAIFSKGPRVHITWALPCVRIEDKPRFAWRGAMLDCARHFIPVPELKRFIEVFALQHFNRLQLHLCDDQAWRMEIKARPRLVEIGAFRSGTRAGHLSAPGFDQLPHGGFYTQEELGELIRFAARRGITLVPEIDLPGHAAALLAAYPQVAAGEAPAEPAHDFGILPYNIFPSPENLEFLAPIFEETFSLFPGKYFHIGGDEVLLDRWIADPRTPDLLRGYGLREAKDLQPWFTRYLHGLASRNGKQIIGWDEIYHAELPDDAIIMSWRGEKAPAPSSRHRSILAPHTHLYFDHYQSENQEEEPLAIGGCITLEKVYHYDPLRGLQPGEAEQVLGIQGQLWTEYLRSTHVRERMAFPRFCAMAEVAWSAPELRDESAFQQRLELHLRRLDVLEVGYRK